MAKSDTHISALVERHSDYASLTDLQDRVPGARNIIGRLRTARRNGNFPKREDIDLLAGLLDEPGRLLLVETLAMDVAMPGFSEAELARQDRFVALFASIPDAEREALLVLVRALAEPR